MPGVSHSPVARLGSAGQDYNTLRTTTKMNRPGLCSHGARGLLERLGVVVRRRGEVSRSAAELPEEHIRLRLALGVFEREAQLQVPLQLRLGRGPIPLRQAHRDYLGSFNRTYAKPCS